MRPRLALLLAFFLAGGAGGCGSSTVVLAGDGGTTTDGSATADGGLGDGGTTIDAAAMVDGRLGEGGVVVDGGGGDAGGGDGGVSPGPACPALPPPQGTVIDVYPGDADELRGIVANAASGTTILVHDGTYHLDGGDSSHRLTLATPGVTLRSASGDRTAVTLDGGYVTQEIVAIMASEVTVADLTITKAYYHPIHVTGGASATITGVRIYNVRVIDPGQHGIKINPSGAGTYADNGVVACSHIELTAAGRGEVRDSCYTGGIDAHAAWGWKIQDNTIKGFHCADGLSEHAVHMWRTSRDTLVERNVIIDCARGVGFGMGSSGTGSDRVYPDDPYPGSGYLGHIDGLIRNNFVVASMTGFDSGIALEQAKGAEVYHNSVVSVEEPFSSIEWRWPNTQVVVKNNLVSYLLVPRDDAQAETAGNVEQAPLSYFVNPGAGDLHLDAAAATGAVDQGVDLGAGLCDQDIDGEPRTGPRDVGADEV